MDDAVLRRRAWASVARQQRLFGTYVPGARIVEGDGFVASVVPSAPDASLLNAAVPHDPDRPPGPGSLAAVFGGAAVRWGVWIDDGGSRSDVEGDLYISGLRVEGTWRVMASRMEEVDTGGIPHPGVGTADPVCVGAVNDRAYGLTDGRLERHFGPLPAEIVHCHRLDLHGDPLSVSAVVDHDGDAGVLFVATLPDRRRRGLGAAVLKASLRAARERGAVTTTLLATPAGVPLYRKLGYRDICEARMWSRPA